MPAAGQKYGVAQTIVDVVKIRKDRERMCCSLRGGMCVYVHVWVWTKGASLSRTCWARFTCGGSGHARVGYVQLHIYCMRN